MNKTKVIIRAVLAALAKFALLRNLKTCRTGAGSRVNFWRIRPCGGNIFQVGEKSLIRAEMVYERDGASIEIGDRTFIGRGLFTIAERLIVGDDVMISWNVTIADHNSHSLRFSERSKDVEMNAFKGIKVWDCVSVAPVIIEDKVWIGFGCSLLKGVTIGEGAVVGANSVVTKDVPPWTIVAGNPARVIREIPLSER
jgi:acetyltransferase-like isoleucine patch superfamily enzyme